jgi:branched-subunit amino acid transport protein
MSEAWTVVIAIGVGTMLIKAAGPVLLGARPLPGPVQAVVPLLAPALLAALVATATLDGGGQRLVLDARLIGLGAGAVALLLRAPVLAVVIVAAAAAAVARLAGIG